MLSLPLSQITIEGSYQNVNKTDALLSFTLLQNSAMVRPILGTDYVIGDNDVFTVTLRASSASSNIKYRWYLFDTDADTYFQIGSSFDNTSSEAKTYTISLSEYAGRHLRPAFWVNTPSSVNFIFSKFEVK